MSGLLLASAVVVAGWLCLGLLGAVRDVLSERAASWLLPLGQPVTFRAAQLVAFLAVRLAPRRYPSWSLLSGYEPWPGPWFIVFPVFWKLHGWSEPESVLAELEADLRAERRVLDPVRLAIPLLGIAVLLRLRFIRDLAFCMLWIPLGLVLFVLLLPIAVFGEEIFTAIGFVRRQLRHVTRQGKTRSR